MTAIDDRLDQPLIEEFAKVVSDRGMAKRVLSTAGYPVSEAPIFDRPLTFWDAIIDEVRHGKIKGKLPALAAAASRYYPGNDTFVQYSAPAEPAVCSIHIEVHIGSAEEEDKISRDIVQIIRSTTGDLSVTIIRHYKGSLVLRLRMQRRTMTFLKWLFDRGQISLELGYSVTDVHVAKRIQVAAAAAPPQKERRGGTGALLNSLADDLARSVSDMDEARMLARRAGFPPPDLPAASTPRLFWHHIVDRAARGEIPVETLLDEVCKIFPYSPALLEYRRRLDDLKVASAQYSAIDTTPTDSSQITTSHKRSIIGLDTLSAAALALIAVLLVPSQPEISAEGDTNGDPDTSGTTGHGSTFPESALSSSSTEQSPDLDDDDDSQTGIPAPPIPTPRCPPRPERLTMAVTHKKHSHYAVIDIEPKRPGLKYVVQIEVNRRWFSQAIPGGHGSVQLGDAASIGTFTLIGTVRGKCPIPDSEPYDITISPKWTCKPEPSADDQAADSPSGRAKCRQHMEDNLGIVHTSGDTFFVPDQTPTLRCACRRM
jgi:Effector-associated domain 1